MRTFNLIFFVFMTCSALFANPIAIIYFNELKVDSIDWMIEFHSHIPDNPFSLDGCYLTSLSDTAYFKNGMVIDTTYLLVTPDSLLAPFHLNPQGDIIMLYDTVNVQIDAISYGSVQGYSMVAAPLSGQSICLFKDDNSWQNFRYLDNSPTFGLANDSLNARGNVEGVIMDSMGHPLSDVEIVYGYYLDPYGNYLPKIAQSNSDGFFRIRDYAKIMNLEFFKENFQYLYQRIQNWPDSTVSIQVMLDPVVAIDEERINRFFTLLINYPNPFNNSTRIGFTLFIPAKVEVSIYDLLGRKIKTLVNESRLPGVHFVYWNGRDEKDEEVSSGVYIYRVMIRQEGSPLIVFSRTRKMMLLK